MHVEVHRVAETDWLDCHRCGTPLLGDPDDEPDGGVDGLPLCGECVRNRDEAADFEQMDLQDGELDGTIDWEPFLRRETRTGHIGWVWRPGEWRN